MIKQIRLKEFCNRTALEMGIKIVDHAKANDLVIGVLVERLNQSVFLYLDDGLPNDKHNWLRRKSNVAKNFEESSLSVKEDLIKGHMDLEETFGLDKKDFIARGGSIPIIVENAGLIATVTVTGLTDVADHQLIVDALHEYI